MSQKSNDAYAKVLMGNLRGLTKRTMIRMVTYAYKEAVSVTHQDSGRAAYNWMLKVGSSESFKSADWYQAPRTRKSKNKGGSYSREFRYVKKSKHPVGYQGQQRGAGHQKIILSRYEDFKINPNNFARSGLFDRLRGGKSGGATKVVLYNPIYDESNPDYVANAFTKYNVADKIIRAANKALRIEQAAARRK